MQSTRKGVGTTDNATLTYFWKRVNQKKATKQKPISRCGQTANKAAACGPTGGPGVWVVGWSHHSYRFIIMRTSTISDFRQA